MKRVPSFWKLQTSCVLLPAVTLAAACSVQSQSTAPQPASTLPFSYEVVSIRPHQTSGDGGLGVWWRTTPDGFATRGDTVDSFVLKAYGLTMSSQISGLPKWCESETFDVDAKMDEETTEALKKLSPKERMEQGEQMMRQLLADRFQLKVHHEMRELPIYALVIVKGGPKLTEAPANEVGGGSYGSNGMALRSARIASLADILSGKVGRLVVDKTGLTGLYDMTLKWTPDGQPESADSGPSIFTALEEQLGLKLVPAKAPVDTVVVDHVEKPSAN